MMRNKRRKSPYKHRVRTHTRDGHTVDSYERGSGAKSRKGTKRTLDVVSRSKKQKEEKVSSGFNVRVEYLDNTSEHVSVSSPSFETAINAGLDGRREYKEPFSIRLRKN